MAGGPEAGARTRADGRGAARALAAPADGLVPAVPVVAPAPLAGGGPWRLPARLAAALGALLAEEVEDRRGTLFLPVGFAIGVALYLGAGGEPSPYAGPLAFAVLLALALAARARPFAFYALALAATLAAGFTVASLQVQRIAHPVLAAPLSGVTVNGFVEQAELRPRGSRIVVRVTSLERAPQLVPERVRIALAAAKPPPVGAHVSLRADLAAPPGPAYPGGFDFGRAAWFEGIGATGYAVGKWRETPAPGPPDRSLAFAAWLEASRQAMAARIRAVLPGEAGGVAVALVTGIRGQVPEPLEEAMRISGLAHVLSISGLHMALVATTVFFFARALLALWPGLALTRPIKAWAAVPALAAATYYLLLSGAEVATQRSYVMTVLVLAGVMLGRPALTLHTLALAALLVLALTPWAILDPGAQMSFAATLALVVAYERGGRHLIAAGAGRLPWYASMPARWLVALALTSLAAGLATAPYAAYHFQRLAPLSLFANLAATPLVSFVIMPMGLLGTLAMPFGWEGPPFRLMGWGIDAMNGVARWVAAMPGADGGVRAMPLASLALITFAFLAACLLRTRLALVALVLAGAAGWPILAARTPDVLVDAQARTVAVRGPDGQLSLMGDRTKGLAERFAAEQWLSAEGRRGQGREPAALSRGASVPASPAATAGKAPSPGSPLPGSPLPFAQEASPAGPVRSTKDGASGAGSLPAMRGAAESGAVPHAGEGGNAGPSLLLPTFVMPAGIELPPQQEQGGPDVSRPAAPDALAPARAAPPEVATIPTEAVAVPAASGASRGDAGPPLARPADPGTSIDAGLQAKRIPSSGAAGEPWGNAGPTPDSPAGSSGPARIPLAQLAAEVAMSVPLVAEAVPASSRDSSDLPPPTSAATPFVSALTPPSQPPDPAAATSAPPASAVLPTSARGSRDPAPSASVATLFASERSLTPAAATSAPPASAVLPASVRGSSDPAPSASVATPFASERPLAPEAATSAPLASAVLPASARDSSDPAPSASVATPFASERPLAAEAATSAPPESVVLPSFSRGSSDPAPSASAATPFASERPLAAEAATSAPSASAVLPTSARGSRDPAPSASVATPFASERPPAPEAATSAPPAPAVLSASARGSRDPAPSASVATPFVSERPPAPDAATSAPPASAVLPTSVRGSSDPSPPAPVAARCDALGCVLPARDGRLVAYPLDPAALTDDCRRAALVVTRFAAPQDCAAEVVRLDRAGEGAGLALRLQPDGTWHRVDARPPAGSRPWLPPGR